MTWKFLIAASGEPCELPPPPDGADGAPPPEGGEAEEAWLERSGPYCFAYAEGVRMSRDGRILGFSYVPAEDQGAD